MSKRNEARVAVKDPSGEIFEVSQRNASDLVQHLGWTYAAPAMSLNDELATAPRERKPRGEKVAEARKKAAEERAALEPRIPKKTSKKTAKKEVVGDDDDVVVPYDEAASELDAELAELEAEEDLRGGGNEAV